MAGSDSSSGCYQADMKAKQQQYNLFRGRPAGPSAAQPGPVEFKVKPPEKPSERFLEAALFYACLAHSTRVVTLPGDEMVPHRPYSQDMRARAHTHTHTLRERE